MNAKDQAQRLRQQWDSEKQCVSYVLEVVSHLLSAIATLGKIDGRYVAENATVELTIDQAAGQLQVSTRTLRRWVAEGLIPSRRIGNELRFNLEALSRFNVGVKPRRRVSTRKR